MQTRAGLLASAITATLALLGSGTSQAADSGPEAGVPLRLDVASAAAPDTTSGDTPLLAGNAADTQDGDFLDDWFARVAQAQATQPHWMTPLATVTPRLEEEFRYDQYWEHAANGASIQTFNSGKGLELIPTTTNEILLNLPTYEDRGIKKAAQGWGDWPFLTVKQRLLSSPEDQGNYILSAFLGVQAPSGNAAFTNHAWVVTPTLAGGIGWGDFDIQGTVGVPLPLSHESTIGTSVVTNVALQYHWAKYFWPELEINDTDWADGERAGKNQAFLTPGLILGRFELFSHARFIIGAGYQFAVSPRQILTPALTPTYDHSWLMTARVAF